MDIGSTDRLHAAPLLDDTDTGYQPSIEMTTNNGLPHHGKNHSNDKEKNIVDKYEIDEKVSKAYRMYAPSSSPCIQRSDLLT